MGRGLIPTYAGNTDLPIHPAQRLGAHPHVCGEHPRRALPNKSSQGSSPRMRGTRDRAESESQGVGLIPTYAGNTEMER